MKTRLGRMLATAVLGAAALAGLAGRAHAAPSPTALLAIDVTINNQLSVKIDGVDTSSRTALVTPGQTPVVNTGSTVTVRSDATAINEFWKLASANAVRKSDGSLGWYLRSSSSGLTTNEFAMQALFISSNAAVGSCPVGTDPAWDQSNAKPLDVATPGVAYTAGAAGYFAYQTGVGGSNGDPDFTSGVGVNGRMKPNSFRGFCYRIVPPSDVTFTENVMAYVIVTASLTQ